MRKEMLRRIHEGHLGIEKCKRRARDVMWWPGMGAEIEECVQRCEVCQRHRATPPREPLAPHPIPRLPWEVLAADIFEFKSKHYLLVVDYYSKFVEVISLVNMKSDTVINKMKCIFSRFGIPRKLVTDNGTQFTSFEFREFTKKWEFEHVTSSPLYPRSNGLAERNVQTVKRLLKKATEDKTEWTLALLNFRNTPVTGEKYSPAQLLMGRSLNTRLPVSPKNLIPEKIDSKTLRKDRQIRIINMKKHYDKGTKVARDLSKNDTVYMREESVWKKGSIIGKAANRSYWVKVDNGGTYRRNSSYIRKAVHKDKPGRYDYLDSIPTNNLHHQTSDVAPAITGTAQTSTTEESGLVEAAQPPYRRTRTGRIVHPPQRYGFE
ncbi:uncharacterized protein K02A2.6-like [Ostrinia furnacalis]|uniref:uncharacterized protein K02A2.6-like n=1 Tax=Ostrinia furnacalis TaxID=93504 RepID=UPI00103C3D19|nr:uncharacterized protein K02A2.6-like [Ostrinia furnacalis]